VARRFPSETLRQDGRSLPRRSTLRDRGADPWTNGSARPRGRRARVSCAPSARSLTSSPVHPRPRAPQPSAAGCRSATGSPCTGSWPTWAESACRSGCGSGAREQSGCTSTPSDSSPACRTCAAGAARGQPPRAAGRPRLRRRLPGRSFRSPPGSTPTGRASRRPRPSPRAGRRGRTGRRHPSHGRRTESPRSRRPGRLAGLPVGRRRVVPGPAREPGMERPAPSCLRRRNAAVLAGRPDRARLDGQDRAPLGSAGLTSGDRRHLRDQHDSARRR